MHAERSEQLMSLLIHHLISFAVVVPIFFFILISITRVLADTIYWEEITTKKRAVIAYNEKGENHSSQKTADSEQANPPHAVQIDMTRVEVLSVRETALPQRDSKPLLSIRQEVEEAWEHAQAMYEQLNGSMTILKTIPRELSEGKYKQEIHDLIKNMEGFVDPQNPQGFDQTLRRYLDALRENREENVLDKKTNPFLGALENLGKVETLMENLQKAPAYDQKPRSLGTCLRDPWHCASEQWPPRGSS